jgi:hypothetical protein
MTDSNHHRDLGKFISGALVVLAGAVLLTSSLGYMDDSFWPNLGQLWLAAIVALGAYLALRRPVRPPARFDGSMAPARDKEAMGIVWANWTTG